MEVLKNVAQSFYDEVEIEGGFFILKFNNESNDIQFFKREIGVHFVQFHFCLKGMSNFLTKDSEIKQSLSEDNSLMLFNPFRDLPLNLTVEKNSWVISVLAPINKMHSLFANETNSMTFLSNTNKTQEYYKEAQITPSMAIVLNQLMSYNLHPMVQALYFKAKVYELLSLYFNQPADVDVARCPFLADDENVLKIKKAKEIITARMSEPPTLGLLAKEINLPINKLKEGFKQIYGDSVFSFLLDYKLEVARQLLATGVHNVNEVALKVGYSTASHFISAFKKKFGTTPKKYLMSLTA